MGIFESDYQLAWAVYLAGALGCLLVGFQITAWMWRWLREVIRLAGAVLLFTPTVVDAEHMLYAPAIAIGALDLLFDTGNNAWLAASDLTLYGLAAFTLYLLFALVRWLFTRRRARTAPSSAASRSPAVADEEDEPFPASGLRADARY